MEAAMASSKPVFTSTQQSQPEAAPSGLTEAVKDALYLGTGMMKGGKHVPYAEFMKPAVVAQDAEIRDAALVEALAECEVLRNMGCELKVGASECCSAISQLRTIKATQAQPAPSEQARLLELRGKILALVCKAQGSTLPLKQHYAGGFYECRDAVAALVAASLKDVA
jgi:hypothetical protein